MNLRYLFRSGLVFTATALGLTVAIYHFAAPLLDLLLPAYQAVLQRLLPDFHLDSLVWRLDRGETVVALNATLTSLTVVLDRVVPAGASLHASTLAAHAWVHPILMLSLVASWPGVALKHRPVAILLALPFAVLGLLLDVPLMLWGRWRTSCIGKWTRRAWRNPWGRACSIFSMGAGGMRWRLDWRSWRWCCFGSLSRARPRLESRDIQSIKNSGQRRAHKIHSANRIPRHCQYEARTQFSSGGHSERRISSAILMLRQNRPPGLRTPMF